MNLCTAKHVAEKDVLGILNGVGLWKWKVKVRMAGSWELDVRQNKFLLRGWLRVRCCFSWKGIVVFSSLLRSLITPFDPIQVMCDHVPKVVFWEITPIAGAFQVFQGTLPSLSWIHQSFFFFDQGKIQPLRRKGNLLLCTILLGNTAVNAAMAQLLLGFRIGSDPFT